MARILLGVSGGIAAYKAVELVRLATGAGHAVRVVQTPASLNFVGRATFEGVTGAPVLVEEFERDPARGAYPGEPAPDHDPISHLELARRADAYCIAPASANTIAKLAGGLADNLLTSAALACSAPLVLAPAMNNHMYEHAATQANLELLRTRGATIVAPESGRLASRGEWGVGRLADPATVFAALESIVGQRGRAARRPARARDRRRHPRADRLGALRGQPLLGPHGTSPGGGGGAARGGGHADRRERGAGGAGRDPHAGGRERRRAAGGRARPSSRAPTCC